MLARRIYASIFFLVLTIIGNRDASAFSYCGYHDRSFPMTSYWIGSDFWVNLHAAEAAKWNRISSVVTIGRVNAPTLPVGRDGRNVNAVIAEADLRRVYGLSWSGVVGWTISWKSVSCGRVLEADLFFNPAISLFTSQTRVPYRLGFQEISLHELGLVLIQNHEDRELAVMTAGAAVSDVLYASDKVGWLRSARFRLTAIDRRDISVFPLRNNGASKIYATLSSTTASRGSIATVRDMTVQNLSSGLVSTGPRFTFQLQRVGGGTPISAGSFSWASFCAYCSWSGSLSFTVSGAGPLSLVLGSALVRLRQRRQAVLVLGLDQPAGDGQTHDGALDLVLGMLWGKRLDHLVPGPGQTVAQQLEDRRRDAGHHRMRVVGGRVTMGHGGPITLPERLGNRAAPQSVTGRAGQLPSADAGTAWAAAWKPILEWVPSHSGFLVDAPQRHSQTLPFVGRIVPSVSRSSTGPVTR